MRSKTASFKKNIFDIVNEAGYECVLVDCKPERHSTVLKIFIDSREGIKHNDCERVSRSVSEYIDCLETGGTKIFPGKYFIEVSSPGIERPLFTEENYVRFSGSKVNLSVKGRGKLHGVIMSCENGIVSLRHEDGTETEIRISDILKGNIAL